MNLNHSCRYLLPLLLFAYISSSRAQFIRHIRLLAGVSNATQDIISDNQSEPWFQWKRGSDFGLSIELFDHPILSALAEVHVVRKGFKPNYPVIVNSDLDYLSLYLMPKVRAQVSIFEIFCFIGPRYDIIVSRNGRVFSPLFNSFPPIDWGATMGIGFEFRIISILSVGIEVRYSPSFRKMESNVTPDKFKNKSYEFVAILVF